MISGLPRGVHLVERGAEVNSPGTPYRSLRVDETPSPGNGAGASGSSRNQGRASTSGEVREEMDGGGSPGPPDAHPLTAPFDGGDSGPSSPAPMTPQPRGMGRGPSRLGPNVIIAMISSLSPRGFHLVEQGLG